MGRPTDFSTRSPSSFRRAVLRGLGMVLPPLLTVVILVWIFNTVQHYVLKPVEGFARTTIHWLIDDTHDQIPIGSIRRVPGPQESSSDPSPRFHYRGRNYVQVDDGRWIPEVIVQRVRRSPGPQTPLTADAYYHRYIDLVFLRDAYVIPLFILVFFGFLYVLGRFLAAGFGRFLWNLFERLVHQLPVIRTVYSSVKQVTDFLFSEADLQFKRVVAVEYPRKGVWSMAFVTGDGFAELDSHAGEPLVRLLVPSSPMPATGYTIVVRKSETIDLSVSVDQAIQFIMSCGVVLGRPAAGREATEQIAAEVRSQLAAGGPATARGR